MLPLTGSGVVVRAPKNNIASLINRHTIATLYVKSSLDMNLTGDLVETIEQDPQTATSVTPNMQNANQYLSLTNAGAITCTIPPNSTVPYPIGVFIDFSQDGAGAVTFAAGAGVTINTEVGLNLTGQWATARALKTATDTWLLTGSLQV